MEETKEVRQIPIEDIVPNRFQPRINFDEEALNELCNSIKQHGIIQPLVVRPLGDKFEIIAGERRYKASTMAGLSSVPAIVTQMDDSTSAEVALVENIQRKDLSAIEEAKSYRHMLDRGNFTQDELAKRMGVSQSTIANKLRLLNLPDEVQRALMENKISERHARSLLTVNNPDEQVSWLNRIITERLTVRQLDLAIKDKIEEEKQKSEDIPIVDINPDIDNIISNAVDINPQTEKPNINVFDGIDFQPNNNVVNNNENNVTHEEPTNKFFNYLEDETINMSMEEPKKEEVINEFKENTSSEMFDFSPIIESDKNMVTEVTSPVERVNTVVEDKQENINNNVDSAFIFPEDNLFDEEIKVEENITENNLNNVELDQINNEDSEVVSFNDIFTNNSVEESEPEKSIDNVIIDNDSVEQIPIVSGENIVDPVALFETLDPDFIDRINEMMGLDLKTAINSYRELTQLLNSKGFNIKIDEADIGGKYHIEIDIDNI